MAKTAMARSSRGGADDSTSTTTDPSSQTQAEQASIPSFQGDNTSLQITAHKLNGRNYLQWSQSVKIVICGRGKLGYITGETKPPAQTEPTYQTWLAENSIVLAWLINSMEPR